MRKSVVVAFFVSIAVGFGALRGLEGYREVRRVRAEESRQRAEMTRVVESMRDFAAEYQRLTAGKGHLELLMLAPPNSGVGIEYAVQTKTQDEKRTILGVRIIGVYRDSSAGRAGMLPGGWVVSVGDVGTCNSFISGDAIKEESLAERERLANTAAKLFANAGDRYTLTIEDERGEHTFTLTRGPVAPAVAAFIREHLDEWDTYLNGLNGEASALVVEVSEDVTTWDEINRRRQRISELSDKINRPWVQLQEFIESQNVMVTPAGGTLVWG